MSTNLSSKVNFDCREKSDCQFRRHPNDLPMGKPGVAQNLRSPRHVASHQLGRPGREGVVDAVRASTVPKVWSNSEGNIALLHHFGGNVPARARHVLDNADRDAGDTTALPPAPPDTTPITTSNGVGRRVRVPAACWPSYPCTEHGGQGWTAHIIALHRANAATVRFTEAADDRGLPFSDVQLDLMILIPF